MVKLGLAFYLFIYFLWARSQQDPAVYHKLTVKVNSLGCDSLTFKPHSSQPLGFLTPWLVLMAWNLNN
jgi:hypothetical protein